MVAKILFFILLIVALIFGMVMCKTDIQYTLNSQALAISKMGAEEIFMDKKNKVKIGTAIVAQIRYPLSPSFNQFDAQTDEQILERRFVRSFHLQPATWGGETIDLFAFTTTKAGKTNIRIFDTTRLDSTGKSRKEFIFEVEVQP